MFMGTTQMNSILSSQNTWQSIGNLNASRVSLNGQSKILAYEIKQDQGRGVDTTKKEETLAKMKEGRDSTDENMNNSITNLNEQLESDREKIGEEEAEQARQEKKAKEKSAADKTEKTDADVSASNTIKTDAADGITKPVEVEISSEGKKAAASFAEHAAHKPAAVPRVHIPAVNKGVDKKV